MDEAALLDARQYLEWHATLDPDIRYSAYANLVRMQGEEGHGVPLFLENHASLPAAPAPRHRGLAGGQDPRPAARARATPMRRRACDSGLPNRRMIGAGDAAAPGPTPA